MDSPEHAQRFYEEVDDVWSTLSLTKGFNDSDVFARFDLRDAIRAAIVRLIGAVFFQGDLAAGQRALEQTHGNVDERIARFIRDVAGDRRVAPHRDDHA